MPGLPDGAAPGPADRLLGSLSTRAESAAGGGPTRGSGRRGPAAPGGGAPAARRGCGMTRTTPVVLFSLTLALLAAPLAIEAQQASTTVGYPLRPRMSKESQGGA